MTQSSPPLPTHKHTNTTRHDTTPSPQEESGSVVSEDGPSTPLEAYVRDRMAATFRPPALAGGQVGGAEYDADGDGEEEEGE
jgi:hypothetical protein